MREITLQEARKLLAPGDPLFFRGAGIVSRLIGTAGRTPYTHVAMYVGGWGRRNGTPMIAEMREWKGGRVVTLESQVRSFPGRIDAYRVNTERHDEFNGQMASWRMTQLAGAKYGYGAIFRAALRHLPFVRFWFAQSELVEEFDPKTERPFCSTALAWAHRVGGGVDPVANLSDSLTEPGDLARSTMYEPVGVLVP